MAGPAPALAQDLDGRPVAAGVLAAETDAEEARRRRAWARAAGCDCARCPLRELAVPVASELRLGARLLIVGEAPGGDEEVADRPFVGASGRELIRALDAVGVEREQVALTNVLACRPPGEWRRYERRLGKANAVRRRRGDPPVSSPVECCLPRLRREIGEARAVLLVGATAVGAARRIGLVPVAPAGEAAPVAVDETGEAGLARLRGFPLVLAGRPALATWHPAFVLRSRRWTQVFRADVGKALRHAGGRLQHAEPGILFDPTVGELDGALARLAAERIVGVDTETDGLDPERVALRCVGLGAAQFGVALGFRSVESPGRAWRCAPMLGRERVANFLASHSGLALHNQAYDRRVLERHGMALPAAYGAVLETLAAHHLVQSEWPHDLGFLASLGTDAPRHKDVDHAAWASDRELHVYCMRDCVATARLAPDLLRGVVDTGQRRVYESDLELQRLGVGMHRAGLLLDEGERRRHSLRLQVACAKAQARADAAAGRRVAASNMDAVRAFLYDPGGLGLVKPSVETDSGEASVDKDALYELLERRSLAPAARAYIEANLDFRRSYKKLSAFVGVWDGRAWAGGPEIGPDGRVHPTYNATTTTVGRLACNRPNVQTLPATRDDPDSLRSMFVAAPGSVFVGCDMDQLHLRLIAARANDRPWLDAFARGLDVHRVNASLFFNTAYDAVLSHERLHMKTAGYLFVYAGGAERALRVLRRMRDPKTGVRPYADMSLTRMETERARFLAVHPALGAWWKRDGAAFRRAREMRSMILGRRRRFLDYPAHVGEDEDATSEIVNFPILGTEGDVMGGAGASGRAMEQIGWPWEPASRGRGMGGAGIVLQNHDSIMVEVSEYRAEEARAALARAMRTAFAWEGRRVDLTCTAKVGRRWSEV